MVGDRRGFPGVNPDEVHESNHEEILPSDSEIIKSDELNLDNVDKEGVLISEKDREFCDMWEAHLDLFRTSDVAEFWRKNDSKSFNGFWNKLRDVVYRVQKLAPQINSVFLGTWHENLSMRDQNITEGGDGSLDKENLHKIFVVKVHLTSLVEMFRRNNEWYGSAITDGYRSDQDHINFNRVLIDFFNKDVIFDADRHGLLTTEQVHQFDDRVILDNHIVENCDYEKAELMGAIDLQESIEGFIESVTSAGEALNYIENNLPISGLSPATSSN